MRSKRLLAMLLVTVLVVGVMPIGSAFAMRSIDSHYPLVVAPGGQVQPAIDWPYVVYKDGRYDVDYGRNPHIRIYNMVTGRDFAISPENKAMWEQSNPSISGTKVVYSDDRHTMGGQECNIWMYDIATGKESVVCSATAGQGNPSIDGNNVVWVDWRDEVTNESVIRMKNLATSVETTIGGVSGDGFQAREPVIDGDYVVYKSYSWPLYDVMLYKISDGTTTKLTDSHSAPGDELRAQDPYVEDGKVAYHRYTYDGSHTYYSIMLYDIASSTETTISTVSDGTNRWHPEIGGGWVTWTDSRSGNMEVYGYNMASHEETCLVPYDSDENGSYAGRSCVGDGWVLWHDHRDGDGDDDDSDLYGMSLDAFTDGTPSATQAMPLQGPDRYQTAVDVCQQAFPMGSDTLVVSTGRNWPDALAGASLAGAYDAPILLVGNTLPDVVADEIERLAPSQVYILGEKAAVAASVEAQIAGLLGQSAMITRLGGEDRYETACIVASETVNALGDGWDGTAFATTGRNWPDALAASPLAAWAGYPVFLAGPDGFDATTEQCMDDLGVTGAVVLGGTVAMPLSVLAQVEQLGVTEIARVGGDNRFETAALIADYGVNELGMSYDTTGISTGQKFPDALSAGCVLGEDGFVMLLTPGTYLHRATRDALSANEDDISQIRFIGGTAALSSTVRSQIMSYVH